MADSLTDAQRVLQDPKFADSLYRSFPNFCDWPDLTIETKQWDDLADELSELKSKDAVRHRQAIQVVGRAAAVETGAIEGLYETTQGMTFTIATQAATLEAALSAGGMEEKSQLISHQLDAYEAVVDFATEKQPIAAAWIRELHAMVCMGQKTYLALTGQGPQAQPLKHGQYKEHPNHVITPQDNVHAYAPVDMVAPEMLRLCDQIESDEFKMSHPAKQAAFAHYGFVAIHPFADGNGRVARALASVFLCRDVSVPLLIAYDSRGSYLKALRSADRGELKSFLDFIYLSGVKAMRMASASYDNLNHGSLASMTDAVSLAYESEVDWSDSDVNEALTAVLTCFSEALQESAKDMVSQLTLRVSIANGGPVQQKNMRRLPSGLNVSLISEHPYRAVENKELSVWGPIVPKLDSEIRLSANNFSWKCTLAEVIDAIDQTSRVTIRLSAEKMLQSMITELMPKVVAKKKRWSR